MAAPELRAETWRRVKPGDNLILADEVNLKARMVEGKGPTPESYKVFFRISIKNKLAEWILYCVNEEAGCYVLAKIVDKTIGLMFLTENSDWSPATRAEIMGTPRDFIFAPPDASQIDPEKGFIGDPNSLSYAADIEHGEAPEQVVYLKKPQGEQSGPFLFNPPRDGVSNWIATVVEYAMENPSEESELMFVEAGEQNNGVIKMMIGRALKVSDVKIMSR